jgi:Fe-S-cluster containining protein
MPSLPRLDCQRKCQASCGPIRATQREREHILRTHGRMLGVDHTGRRCRLLTEAGDCAVYADRPMICRLFGMVKSMRCPHGCEPTRWLTDEEGFAYLAEASR